jgi:hypothetical protein
MPTLLYFADPSNRYPGCGATIRLDNGEPCLLSIAQSGVLVKNSRFGWFGAILYNEKNVYKAAETAMALDFLFPDNLLPAGFTDLVLKSFANAIWHCSTCAEVAVTLNEAVARAKGVGFSLPRPNCATPPLRQTHRRRRAC